MFKALSQKQFLVKLNVTTTAWENITVQDIPKLKKEYNAIGAPLEPVSLSQLSCLTDQGDLIPIKIALYWHPDDKRWVHASMLEPVQERGNQEDW